jgi:sterol desaturase/sphingolipid hydroxylase (fatty acid hydroxylase superfamily)
MIQHITWIHLALTPLALAYVTHLFHSFAMPRGGVTWKHRMIHLLNGTLLGWGTLWYTEESYTKDWSFGQSIESPGTWIKHVLFSLVLTDVYFWTTHRLFHHPWLYSRIHSLHHEFHTPQPWATLYAHPLENIVVNGGVIFWPLYFLQPSRVWTYTWVIFLLLNSLSAHTFSGSHRLHHQHPYSHFGVELFMDRLMRTRYEERSGTPTQACTAEDTVITNANTTADHLTRPIAEPMAPKAEPRATLQKTHIRICPWHGSACQVHGVHSWNVAPLQTRQTAITKTVHSSAPPSDRVD